MPLAGGAADKIGNRYERWWTVDAVLDVLDGRAESIQIEIPGDDGRAAEFRVMKAGVPVWHQVKGQTSDKSWTVGKLNRAGVLMPFWEKITDGGRCVFVSTNSAAELQEITERAVDTDSWDQFKRHMLNGKYQVILGQLRECWGSPPEEDDRVGELVRYDTVLRRLDDLEPGWAYR